MLKRIVYFFLICFAVMTTIRFLNYVLQDHSVERLAGINEVATGEGRIRLVHAPKNTCFVVVEGSIEKGMTKEFVKALQAMQEDPQCKAGAVNLNSRGGNVDAALLMAKLIRRSGLSTIITPDDTCASACSYLFIAGVQRVAYANDRPLGLHPTLLKYPNEKAVCNTNPEAGSFFAKLEMQEQDFVKAMLPLEGSQYFLKQRHAVPCSKINYLESKDLLESGIATKLL